MATSCESPKFWMKELCEEAFPDAEVDWTVGKFEHGPSSSKVELSATPAVSGFSRVKLELDFSTPGLPQLTACQALLDDEWILLFDLSGVDLGPAGEVDGLVGSLVLPDPDQVQLLRLRTGATHWGAIVDHDPDGLRFSLLAHGGMVELPWTMLDPSLELSLRERFGYVDVSTEELLVDVETLLLVDGREVTGVVLSRDGDHFVLKHEGSLQMVPKLRVQNTIKAGRLPALDVYGREELYAMHAAEAAEDDPEAQHELAKVCEQILDFKHAVEHYQRVLELDPDTDRQDVEFALERAIVKAEQQVQIDYLRDVDILRRKKKYDEALARAEAFGETFPGSPLVRDSLELRDRVLVARDDALRDLVRRRWLDHTRRIARTAAKQLTSYEASMAYCDEQYSEDVLAAVHADVAASLSDALEPDDVIAYWATRKKIRFQNATFGLGTWLLGQERAEAGTEDKSAAADQPTSARDAERQALEDKIQKFLQNQARTRQRRTAEEEADDYEAFWAQMSIDDRAQWMRAYYVEYGGDFELRGHPYKPNCPSCGGKGVREIINGGATISAGQSSGGGRGRGRGRQSSAGSSGTQMVACSTCRGIGFQRRIYYR